MATRERNEKRFPKWDDFPNGGRRYYRTIKGRVKGYALYIKEVDADEVTVRIVQEVYDDNDQLIGVHQKYPDDTGHVWVQEDNE